MRVDERTKKQYISEELAESGWNDKIFLTEEDLCARWGLKAGRSVQNFILGRNKRGVRLPCLRLTRQLRRYKPSEVLEFEYETRVE
jgi:hypothetical protein|tara:strand:+ start:2063 stop:2320 length:258 start_codon:yes stop_codon:yes gene_type:complete